MERENKNVLRKKILNYIRKENCSVVSVLLSFRIDKEVASEVVKEKLKLSKEEMEALEISVNFLEGLMESNGQSSTSDIATVVVNTASFLDKSKEIEIATFFYDNEKKIGAIEALLAINDSYIKDQSPFLYKVMNMFLNAGEEGYGTNKQIKAWEKQNKVANKKTGVRK